jgi:hypothetical protein
MPRFNRSESGFVLVVADGDRQCTVPGEPIGHVDHRHVLTENLRLQQTYNTISRYIADIAVSRTPLNQFPACPTTLDLPPEEA